MFIFHHTSDPIINAYSKSYSVAARTCYLNIVGQRRASGPPMAIADLRRLSRVGRARNTRKPRLRCNINRPFSITSSHLSDGEPYPPPLTSSGTLTTLRKRLRHHMAPFCSSRRRSVFACRPIHAWRCNTHALLNTFFQSPVSGEEKKTRIWERISSLSLLCLFLFPLV